MSKVVLDYSKAAGFISEEEVGYMGKLTEDAKEQLVSKSGAGNDFVGQAGQLLGVVVALVGQPGHLSKDPAADFGNRGVHSACCHNDFYSFTL